MHDPDLVRRAQQGSVEAQAELWQSSRAWLTAVLLAHRPQGADVDDLLQDVAVRVLDALRELRDPAALRSWMRRVALHVAASSGRRARVDRAARDELMDRLRSNRPDRVPPTASTPWDLCHREELAHVLEEMNRLPTDLREVLALRAVDGMHSREIAEILELPRTTIEARIARARRELRRRLTQRDRAARPIPIDSPQHTGTNDNTRSRT